MKDTQIISGFPGVGKSNFFKKSDLKVLDSDDSLFDKRDFPDNYINHIKNFIGKVDYILISSHDVVRRALEEHNIEYVLVYPSIELKEEYLERYKNRGNEDSFIAFISIRVNLPSLHSNKYTPLRSSF